MNLSIYFLLISYLSILICGWNPFPDQIELERIADEDQLCSRDHNLKLTKGGEIHRDEFVLVWKGTYNQTIDVAIKIFLSSKEELMRREANIFEVLEATEDFDIKKHRIPRVYYHGTFLDGYFAIAMTLFEETLGVCCEQLKHQKKKFSESAVLLIFKQAVESLSYIHSKNVTHNDIHLWNIFIRGNDVFIGDFGSSLLGGDFMEDYNALLIEMWLIVGVSSGDAYRSNNRKLKYFKNKDVREAFESILSTRTKKKKVGKLPDYKNIIKISDKALAKLGVTSGPVQLDWLKEEEHASSSSSSSSSSSPSSSPSPSGGCFSIFSKHRN